jgi:hypothetical protein
MARGALGGWILDDEGEGPSEVTRLSTSYAGGGRGLAMMQTLQQLKTNHYLF